MLSIVALSIVNAIKDIFLRFQIPFSKLRGQCCDGCSTIAGAKSGVATRIQEIQPRAVFTHCYGHALNPKDLIMEVLRLNIQQLKVSIEGLFLRV